jgi:hypothetical protein
MIRRPWTTLAALQTQLGEPSGSFVYKGVTPALTILGPDIILAYSQYRRASTDKDWYFLNLLS